MIFASKVTTALSAEQSEEITSTLVDWCALDMRPLSISQGAGFRRFAACAVPGYTSLSQTLLRMLMRKKHADGQKLIQDLMRDCIEV